MPRGRVLFVLTGHDRLGPPGDEEAEPTGFHLLEAAHPWAILTDAGFAIDIATPGGTGANIDPSSKDVDDPVNARFLADAGVQAAVASPLALGQLDPSGYAAVYFPGGHGTMWDLPEASSVQSFVQRLYENGGIVGAVCHGPAALVNVRLGDGSWLVANKTVASFTDDEERAIDMHDVMPFLLASTLEARGAILEQAANFERAVAVDERLVTGQNPASADGVGEEMLKLLEANLGAAA
jgi:putative intracellular protease/amidase